MRKINILLCGVLLLIVGTPLHAVEMIIGEKHVAPGIHFIFEGAIKDTVEPAHLHLAVDKTDVHLEVLANWNKDGKRPKGTPAGGFIPYLRINADVTNQKTGKTIHVSLLPHANLVDNFHYARNISLPGERGDLYSAVFYIHPPADESISFHADWMRNYSRPLFESQRIEFRNLNFATIAKSTR